MRSKPRPDRFLPILGGIQSDMQGRLSVGRTCRKDRLRKRAGQR
ncbi:hypothetical protein OJF2_05900 [Aquisphaera giovannonii]|uniref:Uncharacterized protein n=1 Tax=Aquisphaera giovannonii TaxID=406548 RepID=A0A5B9VW89_9BACT|nr:hypothetical protein [Aquisphaera giovannonii]QEH32121.1 hypothetical protein OJF2_05900 [Aquisphaera giovannonii]